MKKATFALLLISLLIACKNKVDNTAESSGLPGEILVITDDEDDLQTILETGYRDSLLIDADIIPKEVFENGLSCWKSAFYDGADKQAHLLIIPNQIDVATPFLNDLSNPIKSTPDYDIYKDIWAKPQFVFVLKYTEDLKSAWIKSSKEICEDIAALESSLGLRGFFKADARTQEYKQLLKSKFGMSASIPPQFQPQKSDSAVVWFIQDTRNFYQHLLFSQINKEDLPTDIKQAEDQRNEFINKHIKNVEKTKIIVSRSPHFRKELKPVLINNLSCFLLRGWYAEEGTLRRGVFYRYFIPNGNQYLVMDAFAFAPSMPKSRFKSLFNIIANTVGE